MDKPRRILFITFDNIGDVVRYTAFLKVLRLQNPAAFIVCVCSSPQNELFKYNNDVDEVIVSDIRAAEVKRLEDDGISEYVYSKFYSMFKFLQRMRFDLVINPFGSLGAVFARFSDAANILGRVMVSWDKYQICGKSAAEFFYTQSEKNKIRVYSQKKMSEQMITLARDVGDVDNFMFGIKPYVPVGQAEKEWAEDFLRNAGYLSGKKLIGIQLRASTENRCWPCENFIELVKMLSKYDDLRIIIFGSPDEAEFIYNNFMPFVDNNCICAAGRTSLLEACALMHFLEVFISGDTGPMHMAAACNISIIGLFGMRSSVGKEAAPAVDKHVLVVENDIRDISVDQVYNALLDIGFL